ncbi:MAG: bacillithiol system redox-active protein YtxJ [Bryobacteraceae bacterium]|jgi:bacillithiol system protein YtxJ
MFRWWPFKHDRGPDRSLPEIANLLERDLVVLFKHSSTCAVSWAAHANVKRFQDQNPQVPVYVVAVQKDRAASQQIAQRLNIRHESPQLIVLRRGVVASVASHGAITEDYLRGALAQDSPIPGPAAR